MEFILWLLAVILVIAGIVTLVRGAVLYGIVLIVVGLLVAYAAMFGFEKLKEILVNATKKDGE